ncbi:MAG: Endolytic murein transglycosylase, partial [Parcubacteria group bacterium]|nr:Endolytic murein transglycosylase [Parcubacteria group bacterium]
MAIRQWVTVIGMLAALHFARLRSFYLSLAILLAGIILSVGLVFFQAPPGFPSGKFITISVGESIGQAAGELKAAHAINSVLLFKVVVRLTPAVHGVQSGTYVFSKPVGILTVARNVTHG